MSAAKCSTGIESLGYELPMCRKEYENYKARIQTFIDEYGSQSKWSCKPPELSPSVCARFGWKCVGEDMLCCISCKSHLDCQISLRLGHKLYKECTQKLVSSLKDAHKSCCPWKTAPCPESYAVMEPVMRHEALDQLRERLRTLAPILSSLPLLSTEQVHKQLGAEAIAKICKLAGEEQTKESERAILLALTGWKTANPTEKLKQLSCEFCCRKVGTWLYASPKELVSEDASCKQENGNGHSDKRKHEEEEMDPVKEHRPWCIWVVTGTSGRKGWVVYSECLLRNLESSSDQTGAGTPPSVAAFQEKVERILNSWKKIKVPPT